MSDLFRNYIDGRWVESESDRTASGHAAAGLGRTPSGEHGPDAVIEDPRGRSGARQRRGREARRRSAPA